MKSTASKVKWMLSLSIVSVMLCLLLLALYFPRPLLVDYLFYEDEPVISDVIILLSGNKDRMKKAAELYEAGYADTVLLTNARASGSSKAYAAEHGIPPTAVLEENEATSTYENAAYVKDILIENGFESAIVVTSNYHMRRSRLAYERVFRGTDITFTYVPYKHEKITRDSWEQYETLFHREYKKLAGAYFLYFDGPFTPLRKKVEEVLDEM